ncbi:MAG: hypothetical protein ABGX23_02120 [Nautiliaceae bacterium]
MQSSEASFLEIHFKKFLFFIFLVFLLALPKVYIGIEIYKNSVKINKLLNEYYSLKAENSILKSKIEKIKFKNAINSYQF